MLNQRDRATRPYSEDWGYRCRGRCFCPLNAMASPTKTILVVDDHRDTRELLVHLLKSAGYVATCVESGAEALAYIERDGPDLVILDSMMPGMSGIDILRAVRGDGRHADLPFVMYTADPGAEAAARSLGVRDFVVKGRFGELKAVVERNLIN